MALFSKFPSRLLSRFLLVLPCQLECWNPTKFSCSRHQGLPEKRVRVQLYLCIWSTGVAQNGCTFFLGRRKYFLKIFKISKSEEVNEAAICRNFRNNTKVSPIYISWDFIKVIYSRSHEKVTFLGHFWMPWKLHNFPPENASHPDLLQYHALDGTTVPTFQQ